MTRSVRKEYARQVFRAPTSSADCAIVGAYKLQKRIRAIFCLKANFANLKNVLIADIERFVRAQLSTNRKQL